LLCPFAVFYGPAYRCDVLTVGAVFLFLLRSSSNHPPNTHPVFSIIAFVEFAVPPACTYPSSFTRRVLAQASTYFPGPKTLPPQGFPKFHYSLSFPPPHFPPQPDTHCMICVPPPYKGSSHYYLDPICRLLSLQRDKFPPNKRCLLACVWQVLPLFVYCDFKASPRFFRALACFFPWFSESPLRRNSTVFFPFPLQFHSYLLSIGC